MKLILELYSKWTKLSPIAFVFTTTILNFILMIPIGIILNFYGVRLDEIGGADHEKYSIWAFFSLVVIVAPIIETFIGQVFPIKLIQKILPGHRSYLAVFTSAIFFALLHYGYSIWYSLLTFPLAILLAKTYIIFQKRQESSYWVTTGVHALRNFIGFIAIYIDT